MWLMYILYIVIHYMYILLTYIFVSRVSTGHCYRANDDLEAADEFLFFSDRCFAFCILSVYIRVAAQWRSSPACRKNSYTEWFCDTGRWTDCLAGEDQTGCPYSAIQSSETKSQTKEALEKMTAVPLRTRGNCQRMFTMHLIHADTSPSQWRAIILTPSSLPCDPVTFPLPLPINAMPLSSPPLTGDYPNPDPEAGWGWALYEQNDKVHHGIIWEETH